MYTFIASTSFIGLHIIAEWRFIEYQLTFKYLHLGNYILISPSLRNADGFVEL